MHTQRDTSRHTCCSQEDTSTVNEASGPFSCLWMTVLISLSFICVCVCVCVCVRDLLSSHKIATVSCCLEVGYQFKCAPAVPKHEPAAAFFSPLYKGTWLAVQMDETTRSAWRQRGVRELREDERC